MNNKPKLVIVGGQAGSGKTTLSKELAKILYFPLVSRDEIYESPSFDVPTSKVSTLNDYSPSLE